MFTITDTYGFTTIIGKISLINIDYHGIKVQVENNDKLWYLAKYRDVSNSIAVKEDDIKFMRLKNDIIKAIEEYEKRTNPFESYHYNITPDFKLERIYL